MIKKTLGGLIFKLTLGLDLFLHDREAPRIIAIAIATVTVACPLANIKKREDATINIETVVPISFDSRKTINESIPMAPTSAIFVRESD
jgi:hypothetical protein